MRQQHRCAGQQGRGSEGAPTGSAHAQRQARRVDVTARDCGARSKAGSDRTANATGITNGLFAGMFPILQAGDTSCRSCCSCRKPSLAMAPAAIAAPSRHLRGTGGAPARHLRGTTTARRALPGALTGLGHAAGVPGPARRVCTNHAAPVFRQTPKVSHQQPAVSRQPSQHNSGSTARRFQSLRGFPAGPSGAPTEG